MSTVTRLPGVLRSNDVAGVITEVGELVARVDAGDLKIDVAERRPLHDLVAVHDQAATGRLSGKTVLIPG